MRSYGQYCALAKALDIVGDRWTLLIVRELLIRRTCRYTDLREGLPGIATNLLVDRLRAMEEAGLIAREEAPPPIATTVFRLTRRGEELEPILYQLGQWGAPLLATASKKDAFQAHWLVLPARHWLADHGPDRPPVKIEIQTGGETIAIETLRGNIQTRVGSVENADLTIAATPRLIASLLTGKVDLAQAQAAGLRYKGDPEALRRLQPLV